METVTDFIFLGSKITADSECSHEIKTLAPWKQSMTNLDSVLKMRDITLPTKVQIVKAVIFPLLHLFLSPAGTTLVPTWEPDSLTPGGAAAPPCHSLGGKAATLHIGSPRTVSEEKSADLGVVINDFDVLFSRTCSPLCVSFLRHLLRAWSCGMWGHIVCLFLSACGLSAPTSQLP